MRRVLIVAAVLALLVLGIGLGLDASGRTDRSESCARRDAAARTDGGMSERNGAAEAGVAAPEGDGNPELLSGIVVNVEGVPVAGAEVVYEPDEDDWPGQPEVRAKSGEDGRFALAVRRVRSMYLVTRHPDYRQGADSVNEDDGEPFRIVMERGTPLQVVVSGPDGVVAGARVEARSSARSRVDPDFYQKFDLDPVVTNEAGIADFGRVPIGWIGLRVSGANLAMHSDWYEVRAAPRLTLRVKLDRGGTIEGVVTDAEGSPVAGARVYDLGKPGVLAMTDAAGRYRISAVGELGIVPAAQADRHGPAYYGDRSGWGKPVRIHVATGEIVRDVDLELGVPSRVRGQVLDADGRGVPGVEVTIDIENGVAAEEATQTGEDGSFELGPLTARAKANFSLRFKRPGFTFFSPRGVWQRRLPPGGTVDVGTVIANRKASIRGRVFDVDGSPLAEGFVDTSVAKAPVRDGEFVAEDVYSGEQEVVAYGFGPRRRRSRTVIVELEDGGQAEVELHIVETETIAGRVVREDGSPPEEVWLAAVPAGTKAPFWYDESDMADDSGRFALEGLVPGEYDVGVYRDADGGYAFVDEPKPQRVSTGRRDLVFTVPLREGTIEGRVVEKATGKPVRLFEVSLYERVMFLPRYRDFDQFDAPTGRFRITAPKAGTYWVDAWAEDLAERRAGPVAVKAGKTVDVGTIALGRPGAVEGVVQDHEGKPVQWCRVYLLGSNLTLNRKPPHTDGAGRYEAKSVAPGTYTVFAVSPQHPLAIRRSVVVTENETARVDVDLPQSAPLTLSVVDEVGRPIKGAELTWTCPDLKPIDSSMVANHEPRTYGGNVSNEYGVIHKPHLPAGDVEVFLKADGRVPVRRVLTLRAGERQGVRIELKSR